MSIEGNLKGVEREALVVAAFAKLGWETFSGNGNTSCDLIALRDKNSLRVEVKGIKGNCHEPSGPYTCTPRNNGSTADCREFDILIRINDEDKMFWQRSVYYKGSPYNLPLREEYNSRTTKRYRERALSMTEKNA